MVEFVKQSTTMRVTHTPEARMRGDDRQQAAMWSYLSLEQRVLQAVPCARCEQRLRSTAVAFAYQPRFYSGSPVSSTVAAPAHARPVRRLAMATVSRVGPDEAAGRVPRE